MNKFVIGQRVAAKIDDAYNIGNLVSIGQKFGIVLDRKEYVQVDHLLVHPVVCFAPNTKALKFEELELCSMSMINLFHIKRDVVFGTQSLTGLWMYLNWKIFGSRLSPIKIVIKDIGPSFGRFVADYDDKQYVRGTQRLIVSPTVRKPYEMLCVLSHEMVHQYQCTVEHKVVDGDEAHDESFFKWNKRFKHLGLVLGKRGNFVDSVYDPYYGIKSVYVHMWFNKKWCGTYSDSFDYLKSLQEQLGGFVAETNDINVCYLVDTNSVNDTLINSLVPDILIGSV